MLNYTCNVVPGGAGCGGPALVYSWPVMTDFLFFCIGVTLLMWCGFQAYDRWLEAEQNKKGPQLMGHRPPPAKED